VTKLRHHAHYPDFKTHLTAHFHQKTAAIRQTLLFGFSHLIEPD
jgi:hypothetical protein